MSARPQFRIDRYTYSLIVEFAVEECLVISPQAVKQIAISDPPTTADAIRHAPDVELEQDNFI
jgi:hypothetical protein